MTLSRRAFRPLSKQQSKYAWPYPPRRATPTKTLQQRVCSFKAFKQNPHKLCPGRQLLTAISVWTTVRFSRALATKSSRRSTMHRLYGAKNRVNRSKSNPRESRKPPEIRFVKSNRYEKRRKWVWSNRRMFLIQSVRASLQRPTSWNCASNARAKS